MPLDNIKNHPLELDTRDDNASINQEHNQQTGVPENSMLVANEVLPYVSNVDEFNQLRNASSGIELTLPTQNSVVLLQNNDFTRSQNNIFPGIQSVFTKYQIPIGFLNRLLQLSEYELTFILDDRLSMKKELNGTILWKHVEERLQAFIDILGCLPISKLTFVRANSNEGFVVIPTLEPNKTEFIRSLRAKVKDLFDKPLYSNGSNYDRAVQQKAYDKQAVFVLTNGVPPRDEFRFKRWLSYHPLTNPITIINICDKNESVWSQFIEDDEGNTVPALVSFHHFEKSKERVSQYQGKFLPYNEGICLALQLVQAISPDLELFEELPFSKYTLDNFLGFHVTKEDYRKYWLSHPTARQYEKSYQALLTIDEQADKLIFDYENTIIMRSFRS